MLQAKRDFFTNWRADALLAVAAAATLTKEQQVVLITNGAYAITLPSVSEAAGRLFTFLQQGSGTNDVTITDNGDDPAWTDVVIDAQYEKAAIYSDGLAWHLLEGATS